jgi:hypothetical protein
VGSNPAFGTMLETKGIPAIIGVLFQLENGTKGSFMEGWNECGSHLLPGSIMRNGKDWNSSFLPIPFSRTIDPRAL